MESVRRTVQDDDIGLRLDVFLTGQPEVGVRPWAKALIQEGYVTVGGEKGKPGQRLTEGDEVVFRPQPLVGAAPREVGPAPELPVLYEDSDIVVIDKPVGIAAHPPDNRRFKGHTIASLAESRYGPLPALQGEDRPGIVHRLDRDTSGVMVLARNEASFNFLRAQFKERTVHKEYRALCWGKPRFASEWIERAIGPDPAHPERMTVLAEGGRESTTYYEVLEQFDSFCHVLCRPRTGRTHQIRVHMTSVGHGLVGDRLYKARRYQHARLPEGAPDPGRQCLHAYRLALPHPRTHEQVEFSAEIPSDMTAVLRWVRGDGD